MAVVLPSEPSNKHYFASSSLRRSSSQPKLYNQTQKSTYPPRTFIRSKSNSNFGNLVASPAASPPSSSLTSSPTIIHADSSAPSYNSTPASSLSFDSQYDVDDEDQILFPSYDDDDEDDDGSAGYFDQIEDLEPPASPRTGDSYTVSPTSNSTSTNISRPDSPEPYEHAEDDTAVRILPSRHVDYLSHNWKEEDIWSSWKLIVSRRNAYGNSARLENASWRTWTKAKNKLKTVSPETLNWLKDCDVTWLYGPLQTGTDMKMDDSSPPTSSQFTKNNSFLINKKPILKKRSVSEIMLQRSLSASSLLKQAAAAVHAQQLNRNRPSLVRTTSDYVAFPFSSHQSSRQLSSTLPSVSTSSLASPGSNERKHIHFNEQVEQCIALEMKGEDEEEHDSYAIHEDYDSDSDDGAIMMKPSNSTRKLPQMQTRKPTARPNFTAESKTIAMLPSTTLKYREDALEPPETAMKHSGESYIPSELSRSPSQETLRPSKPSSRILLGDDDDDEDDDADMDWHPPSAFANRKDSVSVTQERLGGLHKTESLPSLTGEPSSGMRRTPSGMFMPYEEDEDDVVSEGLFGKVVDTVNTAKDIAHVIWNVGWRR